MLLSDAGKKELAKYAAKGGGANGALNMDELPYQAGCTATVGVITKTEVYVANSGDTRAVIASKGKAKDMSHDHKPDNPPEKRRVERAGGFVEDGRVQGIIGISRAIGDWEYKNPKLKPEDNMVTVVPEVIVETIRPDHDFLIIACDGIWDCLTSQQAVDFVYEQKKKMAGRKSMMVTGSSSGSSTAVSAAGSGSKAMSGGIAKKGATSPTKRPSVTVKPGASPTKSPVKKLAAAPDCLSRIVEMMMDKICPTNLAASEGLGADNMTCMIIDFKKDAVASFGE